MNVYTLNAETLSLLLSLSSQNAGSQTGNWKSSLWGICLPERSDQNIENSNFPVKVPDKSSTDIFTVCKPHSHSGFPFRF